MYTSFRVRNFRCFEDLEIKDLERVNLIAGANNVGKTALLEALRIHGRSNRPDTILHLVASRGYAQDADDLKMSNGDAPWRSLFSDSDESRPIEIGASFADGRTLLLRLTSVSPEQLEDLSEDLRRPLLHTTSPDETLRALRLDFEGGTDNGPLYLIVSSGISRARTLSRPDLFPLRHRPARCFPANRGVAERFGKMVKAGREHELLEPLRLVEPRLKRLETVYEYGEPVLHGDLGAASLVSILDMGGGMVQLADILLSIRECRKGVVLIDEFENGLHHSVLKKVWRAVAETARECDAQVFATTHSFECIAAAHDAFVESGTYDFRLHRLERVKGKIKAITYDQGTLGAALEMNLEVR